MVTPDRKKNLRVAGFAVAISLSMLGLAYASVPLYRLFCQVTGFGGTPQRVEAAPQNAVAKTISIRFDANTAATLGWAFHPLQPVMSVKLGEQNMAHYQATNQSDKTVTGSAIFNVTPENAGIYFNKIECFCFTEQTLKPGETVDMPVQFFVDPDILTDDDAKNISEITLSYTFYPVSNPKSVSQAKAAGAAVTN